MKNTILCASIALLPASLLADERSTIEPRQDNIYQLKFDWHLTQPKEIGFDWFGTEHRSPNLLGSSKLNLTDRDNTAAKLAEIIKKRDQLKKRLAELESLIENLSKP